MKIGHISDLHLRIHLPGSAPALRSRSRHALELLHSAIDLFKEKGVSFIAFTGDLLDVPEQLLKPDDYYDYPLESWSELALKDYLLLKQILDDSGIPYMVLPGNHDKESIMWKVFDPNINEVIVDDVHIIRFCDRELGRQAHRFDRERKRMYNVLSSSSDRLQIHLQHFVITPELNDHYPHTYYDGKDIYKNLVKSNKSILALSGHFHKGTPLISDQKCTFSTVPAVSEFPHLVRVYEVKDTHITFEECSLKKEKVFEGRPVAFLDRDGVINTLPSYTTGPDEMELIEGAAEAIVQFHQKGHAVVVITNQSCIGLGHVSKKTVEGNHEVMCDLLMKKGGPMATPDLILFSMGAGDQAAHPDYAHNDGVKPSIALPLLAQELIGVDPHSGFFVGDNVSDFETAKALNIPFYLVQTGNGKNAKSKLEDESVIIVDSLLEVPAMIL